MSRYIDSDTKYQNSNYCWNWLGILSMHVTGLTADYVKIYHPQAYVLRSFSRHLCTLEALARQGLDCYVGKRSEFVHNVIFERTIVFFVKSQHSSICFFIFVWKTPSKRIFVWDIRARPSVNKRLSEFWIEIDIPGLPDIVWNKSFFSKSWFLNQKYRILKV